MNIDLIDIGANLTHDAFHDDRDAVIERAVAAGVGCMIVTGSSEGGSRDAVALAETQPGRLYATVGIHPHHAADYSSDVGAGLLRMAENDCVVAIGECGLDYFRDFSPREAQREAFEKQLELAAISGLPVFLHQREAHADFVEILTPMLERIPRAVAHCFTGDETMLREYLDMGLYIGITGWICDERRGAALRAAAPGIPLDRLMLETDAPYLLPRTLKPRPSSRRNEPAWLGEVLREFSRASGQAEDRVARATTENAESFFGL